MPDNAATIARTVLCAVMIAAVGCSGAHAGDSAGPVWPTRQWQTSTPEAQGMPARSGLTGGIAWARRPRSG